VAAVAARVSALFHVQHYFYAWRDSGVLEWINFELLQAREAAGREPPITTVER